MIIGMIHHRKIDITHGGISDIATMSLCRINPGFLIRSHSSFSFLVMGINGFYPSLSIKHRISSNRTQESIVSHKSYHINHLSKPHSPTLSPNQTISTRSNPHQTISKNPHEPRMAPNQIISNRVSAMLLGAAKVVRRRRAGLRNHGGHAI